MTFETERLILRRFALKDWRDLKAYCSWRRSPGMTTSIPARYEYAILEEEWTAQHRG